MPEIKRTWIGGLVIVAGLLVLGLYFAQGSRVPLGQPPLLEMNAQALSALQTEFNRTSAGVRVIVLLSPT